MKIIVCVVALVVSVQGHPGLETPSESYGVPEIGVNNEDITSEAGLVHKHYFEFVPSIEPPQYQPSKPIIVPEPQTHHKIIFIKAPTPPTPTAPQIPIQPQDEEKTLVYVLVKKPEDPPEIEIPTAAPTEPSKPEVYFIRYNTKKDKTVAAGADIGFAGGNVGGIESEIHSGSDQLRQTGGLDGHSGDLELVDGGGYGKSNSGVITEEFVSNNVRENGKENHHGIGNGNNGFVGKFVNGNGYGKELKSNQDDSIINRAPTVLQSGNGHHMEGQSGGFIDESEYGHNFRGGVSKNINGRINSGLNSISNYEYAGRGNGFHSNRYDSHSNRLIFKHIYVHVPSPDLEERPPPPKPIFVAAPQKHFKLIFINAPTPPTPTAPVIPVIPQNEEKTLLYILTKKPEDPPEIQIPTPIPTLPTKPEVYFIKYKTQKEENDSFGYNVEKNIKSEYGNHGVRGTW